MIRVTREAPDKLSSQEWRFYTNANTELRIRFAEYVALERASKRHSYRAVKVYNILDRRKNTITFAQVTTPQDVADEALDILVKSLVFEWEWK